MAPPPPLSFSTSCSLSLSSAKSSSSLAPHRRSHIFTPIQEGNETEETEERRHSESTPTSYRTDKTIIHHPTPLHHHRSPSAKPSKKKRSVIDAMGGSNDRSVSCGHCRPTTHRDKNSVVPVDNNGNNNKQHAISMPSPNGILKSILLGLSRKSPKPSESSTTVKEEEQWKIAVAELSHKLVSASRKRDEAIVEASRLKYSMAELEKKLNKLEIYCHTLKSGLLDVCSNSNQNSPQPATKFPSFTHFTMNNHDKVVENFLVSVSQSRSSVRSLSRALTVQLRQMGGAVNAKIYERMTSLLLPYDIRLSFSRNPRSLLFYLEALLNAAFFEDFEAVGFAKSSTNGILNPMDRCEANYGSFNLLRDLTWEEVLSKGTRHFSEGFSRFCDRKMSEIVAMLGWNRAWPEQLLQAFFGASKNVWLVHLLANSVHPSLSVFRVEKGSGFDSVYMEDMGGDKAARSKRLVPSMVRIMVAPGFYVYDNVVKCKVLCRYYSNSNSNSTSDNNICSSYQYDHHYDDDDARTTIAGGGRRPVIIVNDGGGTSSCKADDQALERSP